MKHIDAKTVRQGIAIGIIGPHAMVGIISETIKAFPTFEPTFRTYRMEEEAPQLAAGLQDRVEVILFTGIVPYKLTMNQHKFSIPLQYIPLTGTGLYRSLFRMESQVGLASLSVDTISSKAVTETLLELGHTKVKTVHYHRSDLPTRDELLKFHIEQFESGACTAVLTGLKSVSEQLAIRQIPNEWLVPTEQDMIVSLERALLSTETRRSLELQTVVGFIHVDGYGALAENEYSEHDSERLRLDIHRLLLEYADSLDGYLTHRGGDEYLFITTRGIFERETGGYKTIPIAEEIETKYGVSLSIGIGFGRSAREAGAHARFALRSALDGGGSLCFIVREDGSMIGPLQMTKPLEYDMSLIDAGFIGRMEKIGLNVKYLSKLIAYMTRTGKTDFMAGELAAILGVTVRTAHRFLLTWLDAGMVEIVGSEKGRSRGRPKQIHRLHFLMAYMR